MDSDRLFQSPGSLFRQSCVYVLQQSAVTEGSGVRGEKFYILYDGSRLLRELSTLFPLIIYFLTTLEAAVTLLLS